MGLRKFGTSVTADVTLVTTAETVIATLSGVSTSQPGQTLTFEGDCTLTTGTNTTAVTLRVRRDSVSGTEVGESVPDAVSAAAGSVETHQIVVADSTLGEFGSGVFVLTAAQTGASADGTVSQCSLRCEVTP